MTAKKPWKERRPIPVCQLGVLHAFGPGYLHAPNKMLEFQGSGERRLRVPLRELKLVCLYGPVRVSAGAIRLVTDRGAALAYLSAGGMRTNGTLQPAADAWRGRRYRQFRAVQDAAWTLQQARQIVDEKVAGIEATVRHLQRHGRGQAELSRFLAELPDIRQRVLAAASHASLRGYEGTAARRWFEVLDAVLPEGWSLPGRHKRPPTDPVNALLSLGYTLLLHRVEAACIAWGLDTALGVYHDYRPGRASLACDLAEPFRVPVVDRLLLKCLGLRQFHPEDFVQDPSDLSIRLSDEAWKRWLAALEAHIHDPGNGEVTFQVAIVERVRRLAEALPVWQNTTPVSAVEPAADDADETWRGAPLDASKTS
jgi:CRISPR-associated protein Cas1